MTLYIHTLIVDSFSLSIPHSLLPLSLPPPLQQSPSHTAGATAASCSAGPVLHSPGLVAGGPNLIEEDEHGEFNDQGQIYTYTMGWESFTVKC